MIYIVTKLAIYCEVCLYIYAYIFEIIKFKSNIFLHGKRKIFAEIDRTTRGNL